MSGKPISSVDGCPARLEMAASKPGGLLASYASVGELATSVQSRWVAGRGQEKGKDTHVLFPAGRDVENRACRWRIAHFAAVTPAPTRHCGDPAQSKIQILAKVSVRDKDARGFCRSTTREDGLAPSVVHAVMPRSASDTAHDSGAASDTY